MRSLFLFLMLLAGCKSTSYFITSNAVSKRQATLYLLSRDTIPGELTVDLEDTYHIRNGAAYGSFVEIKPGGRNSAQRIPLSQILGYRMGTMFYALKVVDINMNGFQRLLFLHQLTPDSSKISLYELQESGQANATGESLNSNYLSLPGFGSRETINTRGTRLLPQFDVKMSEIVTDCPALADKIRSKDKGYFIPFVTFDVRKHPDVLLRIINEYNNCRETAAPQAPTHSSATSPD
jgi:hypothetical protein